MQISEVLRREQRRPPEPCACPVERSSTVIHGPSGRQRRAMTWVSAGLECFSRSFASKCSASVLIAFGVHGGENILRLQGRAERAGRRPAHDPAREARKRRRSDGRGARRGGRKRPRDTRRNRTGSSALAPAAHGGLPPERYPGTARHRSAAVTSAERAHAGTAILPAL